MVAPLNNLQLGRGSVRCNTFERLGRCGAAPEFFIRRAVKIRRMHDCTMGFTHGFEPCSGPTLFVSRLHYFPHNHYCHSHLSISPIHLSLSIVNIPLKKTTSSTPLMRGDPPRQTVPNVLNTLPGHSLVQLPSSISLSTRLNLPSAVKLFATRVVWGPAKLGN